MEKHFEKLAFKLEGTNNWTTWKFQLRVLLQALELYDVVEKDALTKMASEDFIKKDRKAQSLIVLNIHEKIMVHIINAKSASEMWAKLSTIYEKKSSTSLHIEQQKFFHLQCEDDVILFISKLEEIRNKINQLDSNTSIPDKMFITKILMGLPSKYKHFIAAWESVPESNQTIDELTARLLIEEERMKESSSSVALTTKSAVQSQHRNKCYSCGKPGHIKKECRYRIVCHYCKKSGHSIGDCWIRKNKENQRSKKVQHTSNDISNAFVANISDSSQWIVDTGASEHMSFQRESFSYYQKLNPPKKVIIGDGTQLDAEGQGTIELLAYNGNKWIKTTISNVLYVPKLTINLFSARSVMDKGHDLHINSTECKILKNGMVVAVGVRKNKLYMMRFTQGEHAAVCKEVCLIEWHKRLGHQNLQHVRNILNKNNIMYEDSQIESCEDCIKGKMHKFPFEKSNSKSTKVCELVHMDVCGPMEVCSLGQSRFFLLIKDDYSGYRYVYFLKNKYEVYEKIKKFLDMAEKETGNKIKIVRTDNGKEFINNNVKKLFEDRAIRHQTSVVYTAEQNGKIERDNRTVVECARTMLLSAKLNKNLWAEAVNTAVFNLNRTGKTNIPEKSPFDIWFNKKYDISHLKLFGSKVHIHVPDVRRQKWDSKSLEGVFVGYGESGITETKGYRIYIPTNNTIEVKRDVIFIKSTDEKQTDTLLPESEVILDFESITDSKQGEKCQETTSSIIEQRTQEITESDVQETPQRSHTDVQTIEKQKRQIKKPLWWNDYETSFLCVIEEPKSYEEAVSSSYSEKWQDAMNKELQVLNENNTWTEVPVPIGKNVIDCKWVYRVKCDMDGNPTDFKARLVARGFQQNDCFEVYDIYAPVARLSTFRVLLAIANKLHLPVHHLDVRSAFLYGNIDEEVYMKTPKGAINKNNIVLKLNKSIYGLKKSPKYWNLKFHSVITKKGFVRSENDYCLYSKCEQGNKIYLLLFVDDILLCASDYTQLCELKTYLSENFCMKDLGPVKNYLGISVNQNIGEGTTELSQENYLKLLLLKLNMSDCKTQQTPMENKLQLVKSKENDPFYERKCRALLGSLIYAVQGTRPDLCFAVSYLSRFQNHADEKLYNSIKRVLRYVKNTINLKLIYSCKSSETKLSCYVDSDWGSDINDRKSTSGFLFKLFDCTVAWSSKKNNNL